MVLYYDKPYNVNTLRASARQQLYTYTCSHIIFVWPSVIILFVYLFGYNQEVEIFIYLSTYLCIHLSIYLSIQAKVNLANPSEQLFSIFLSLSYLSISVNLAFINIIYIYLSIVSIDSSIYLSIYLSLQVKVNLVFLSINCYLSIYKSIDSSFYLSIYLPISVGEGEPG